MEVKWNQHILQVLIQRMALEFDWISLKETPALYLYHISAILANQQSTPRRNCSRYLDKSHLIWSLSLGPWQSGLGHNRGGTRTGDSPVWCVSDPGPEVLGARTNYLGTTESQVLWSFDIQWHTTLLDWCSKHFSHQGPHVCKHEACGISVYVRARWDWSKWPKITKTFQDSCIPM